MWKVSFCVEQNTRPGSDGGLTGEDVKMLFQQLKKFKIF